MVLASNVYKILMIKELCRYIQRLQEIVKTWVIKHPKLKLATK